MAAAVPESKLWAISTKGNVYTLSTKQAHWQHVHNQGQVLRGFKRISSTHQGAWGLGCDHQVYVFVAASDLPIRCQVTTYENERWVPSRGWSSRNLLKGLDPWQWSSEDGNVNLPKDSFRLPSENWMWESDWLIDENVKGFLTDKGGWRYANVDFRGQFSHVKTFKSCVRRRKWIRHYKYISTNVWARIPSIHVDPLEEPIVDLSAGGHLIPNQAQGFVSVWIVTIDGRVLYRAGVSQQSPEGLAWVELPVEEEDEVLSVSVGPTDLVWAVTWSGDLLVRTGIEWQQPKGVGWLKLDAPDSEDKIIQVTCGDKAVWITSVSGNVWLRKGIKESGDTEKSLRGTGWLQMVNKMKMVTIGPLDKILGIEFDDRQIYFREGISQEEPSGRKWAGIDLPLGQVPGIEISSSIPSLESSNHSSPRVDYLPNSLSSDDTNKGITDSVRLNIPQRDTGQKQDSASIHSSDSNDSFASALSDQIITHSSSDQLEDKHPDLDSVPGSDELISTNRKKLCDKQSDTSSSEQSISAGEGLPHSSGSLNSPTVTKSKQKTPAQYFAAHLQSKSQHIHKKTVTKSKKVVKFLRDKITKDLLREEPIEKDTKGFVHFSTSTSSLELVHQNDTQNYLSISPPHRSASDTNISRESLDSSEYPLADNNMEGNDIPSQLDNEELLLTLESSENLETEPDDADVSWLWLSANMCFIQDDSHIKHWFTQKPGLQRSLSESVEYQRQLSHSGWRNRILSLLCDRRDSQLKPYHTYIMAIDRSCWVKKGRLSWWSDTEKKIKWLKTDLELVQDSDTKEKDGIFTMQYSVHKQPKYLSLSLQEIVAVCTLTEVNKAAVFGIYLSTRLGQSSRLPPIKIAASGEDELEDWVAALGVACCDHRGVGGSPSSLSAWAITDRGEVFVHEPDPNVSTEFASEMFWHQYGGHMRIVETCPAGVTWGLGYDGRAYVYTNGYGGAFFKGMATSPHGIHPQTDTREMFVYENQRWRPISGYTDRVLFTDSYKWSDASGKVECTKDSMKLPSKHWAWSSDWMVDRRLEGGVDKEGWQYGRKLNRPFYKHPRINSVIRRRRWFRKCFLVTSGPWEEVPPHPLQDISLHGNHTDPEALVTIWAIGSNGEVLYRTDVNKYNTRGISWVHVPTDLECTSVSVGGQGQVWVIASDGSAWLRHGINEDNPTGDCWVHISPPKGEQFVSVSAGTTSVWSIDKNNCLWCRKGITSSYYEGLEWVKVAQCIRHVSCGPKDQVWTVCDQVAMVQGKADGVISRRVGLGKDKTKHGSWDYGIGGGWNYVTVRGWMK